MGSIKTSHAAYTPNQRKRTKGIQRFPSPVDLQNNQNIRIPTERMPTKDGVRSLALVLAQIRIIMGDDEIVDSLTYL